MTSEIVFTESEFITLAITPPAVTVCGFILGYIIGKIRGKNELMNEIESRFRK